MARRLGSIALEPTWHFANSRVAGSAEQYMETSHDSARGWQTPTEAEKRDSVNRANARMKQRVTLSLLGHGTRLAGAAHSTEPPLSVPAADAVASGAAASGKDSRGSACPV
jgi:hypothetical protein